MFRRLVKGVGANLYSQIVVLFAQFALVPIFASHWGLEKYGLWLLLSTIPSYLSLSDFGFATAAATKMTMEVAKGNRDAARQTFQSAWLAILLTSIPMAMLAVSIGYLLPDHWFSASQDQALITEMRTTLVILVIFAAVCLQGGITQAGFRCSGQYATGIALQSTTMLCEAVAAIVVVSSGGGFIAVAITYLAIRILALTLQATLMIRSVAYLNFGFGDARLAEVKTLLRPAMAVMALPAAQAVFLQGTTMVVGLAVSAAAVPAFTSVRTLTRAGVQLTTLLNHAIMPELSMAAATDDQAKKERIVASTIVGSLVVVIPFGIGLLLFGPWFIHFWTHGMIAPPFALLLTMTIVMVINGIWHPLSNLLLAVNRQESYSYMFLVAAAGSVTISYPLALTFGVVGAGLGILCLDMFMAQHVLRSLTRHVLLQQPFSAALRHFPTVVSLLFSRLRPNHAP